MADNASKCNSYTTTKQIFNGRDQVLRTRQYAGAEGSSTYQDVSMSYDGDGRMKTRHYPIEDANTETTWNYDTDDSISQVIDPRGAITNFSYNSRGLVSQISYQVPSPNPSNIQTTPTVNFDYDALGNRTQMTDGLGTQTYVYDQLSRLTSETRSFSDSLANAPLSNNSYKIEYGYNLGGGLKFYKDPFGQQIDYTNDKTGKLTAVDGSSFGTGNGATTDYANGIEYRAWGDIERLTYDTDDDALIKMQYDNRLRVNQYEVESDLAPNDLLRKSVYSYFADSRPSAFDDAADTRFDKSYKYDAVGRLTYNYIGNYPTETVYTQTVGYDRFSQMTSRTTSYWGNGTSFSSSYTNGRETTTGVSGTTYDAAGNQTNTGSRGDGSYQATKFDVANRRSEFKTYRKVQTGRYNSIYVTDDYRQSYDGDGHQLKREEYFNNTLQNKKYQIWSSVLQSYLTETTSTGAKEKTKVYAGGEVIAEQMRRAGTNNSTIDEVVWIHADPVSGSSTRTSKDGSEWYRTEYEPLGNQELSLADNNGDFPEPPVGIEPAGTKAEDPQWQCDMMYMQGLEWTVPVSCGVAAMANPDVFLGGGKRNNPSQIPDDPQDSPIEIPSSPVDPTPTDKPTVALASKAIPKSSIPSDDGDELMMIVNEAKKNRSNENVVATVNVRIDWGNVSAEFGGDDKPYEKIGELRTEFYRRLALNSGECEKKLQALINELGKDTKIRKFAENFFKGKGDREIRLGDTRGSADYGYAVITIDPGKDISSDGFNFIHELMHAAGGLFVGATHEEILRKMAKIDKFNFDSIKKEVEDSADKEGLKGEKRKEWIEARYSGRVNNWLGNYCSEEGGMQVWKDYVKKHQ